MSTPPPPPFDSNDAMSDLLVREDTEGTWDYHLAVPNTPNESLCGERVMGTSVTLDQWGHTTPSHLPITFCQECDNEALSQQLSLRNE